MQDIDCPSLKELMNESLDVEPCLNHTKVKKNEFITCAERNVKLLKKWWWSHNDDNFLFDTLQY